MPESHAAVDVEAERGVLPAQVGAPFDAARAFAAPHAGARGDAIADRERAAGPDLDHLADELVAHDQAGLDRVLCPLVPCVDVEICPADAGAENPDEDLAWARFWLRNVLQPQPRLRLRFDQRLH